MLLNKKISLNVSTRFYLHFALILEIKILLVLDLNRVEISEEKTIFFFTTLTIFIMFCYKANNLLICYHLGSLADHYFLCLLSIILTVALLTQSTGLWIISAAEAALTLTCIYSRLTWRHGGAVKWPLAVNTPLLSTQSAIVSTLSLLTHHLYLAAIAVIGFQLRRFKLCNCNCCYKGEHFTLCRCLDWVLGQPAIDCNNCPRDKINNPPRGSPVITTSSCSTHWEETFPDWQQPSSGGRAFRRNFQYFGRSLRVCLKQCGG